MCDTVKFSGRYFNYAIFQFRRVSKSFVALVFILFLLKKDIKGLVIRKLVPIKGYLDLRIRKYNYNICSLALGDLGKQHAIQQYIIQEYFIQSLKLKF